MDFAYQMTQQIQIPADQTQDLDDDWTSSLNPHQSSTQSMLVPGEEEALYNADDFTLDFGEHNDVSVSINVGRSAPTPQPEHDDILGEEEVLFHDDDAISLNFGGDDVPMIDEPQLGLEDEGLPAIGDDEPLALGDDETLQLRQAADRVRDTESPLSEAGSEMLRELDQTFQTQLEPEEEITEIVARQPQRSRKQKPLAPDMETVLHNSQIKAQAEDRSKILRAPSFLPRDPVLLTLMSMQKNGDFVLNAINDGRSKGWAPELQGLLSFESLTRSTDRKRKRDSGIGGLSEDEHSEKSPRLEGPDVDEGVQLDDGIHANLSQHIGEDHQPLASELGPALEDMVLGEDDEGIYGGDDGFDETTMPLVHPADSGPVSLGTKHAVHLLRERLGDAGGENPSSPAKKSVLLQELVPEHRTGKEDATKMFFEVLVLATKDAIKVEQGDKSIGMPLRIRAKRGLWGSWAETSPSDDPTAQTAASQQVAVEA